MTFSDVNRIVSEQVNLAELVSKYVKLESESGGYKGLCPFHREKTPSFKVRELDQYFHCFGCGASGNAITFLMQIESISFPEAVRKLGEDFKIKELLDDDFKPDLEKEQLRKNIFDINKFAAKYFHMNLARQEDVCSYLKNRGILDHMAKKFGIGYIGQGDALTETLQKKKISMNALSQAGLVRHDKKGNVRSFFYNRLMIPIINHRRQVIGFGGRVLDNSEPKYLNSPDTPVFNKKENLFGLNFLREGLREYPYIIMVEGYFDVIALHQEGFPTGVASLGTSITSAHLKRLERFNKPVVLLMDGDEAGRRAMKRVLDLNIPESLELRVSFIPEEGEDPDSLLKKPDGKKILDNLVKGADPIFKYFIDSKNEQIIKTEDPEERSRLEMEIMQLQKKIPKQKKSAYKTHVKSKLNKITTVKERSDISKIIDEVFYVSLSNQPLIPALSSLEKMEIRAHDMNNLLDYILDSYYNGTLNEELRDTVDRNGWLEKKYADADVVQFEHSFMRLMARLQYFEVDLKIKRLQHADSDDVRDELLNLIEERHRLKIEMQKIM